ncbi:esterase-like activity of phytase family protein [Myceligenerans pegani]|uniref:Esterase-like activity of phytase family protein n=1 Tax=Myceligenerans pegani TaxID=2776917 RepID=A0ABR9N085_9MICO|nr:esterase-like activity of phytase family protein [Myceligenerans sp. TRM 65318]MBE1877064.1 esterase-like activity of phytase family protein [Myceligenerans sp. TRM 65318]MBE3019335.1 esterase-like activity of phytase family protein [Myceligenerans sp. TRM 65318]
MSTQKPHSRRTAAFIASGATLALGLTALVPASAAAHGPDRPSAGHSFSRPATFGPSQGKAFHRLATYPVFQNAPADVDPADETVAEISDVSEDGRTVVYTDAAGRRIGFLDITDPAHPRGLGSLDLAELGDAEDEPTSVAVVGDHVLVVVNTSESYANPSGRLDVVDLATRTKVRSIDLGGQPDSIAITPDGAYAVVAIENERDEDVPADNAPGGDEGDLPQAPAGFVQIVDLPGTDPAGWSARPVPLTATDGSALPALAGAGLDTPEDPEPEYVAINPAGTTAAVSLQENNGIVLIDVASGEVTSVFSAGEQALTGVDTIEDDAIDLTGTLDAAPREPDAIAWIDDQHLATANEGDWKGGTRGWSVFDAATGEVAWDAGNTLEHLAARVGLHNDGRTENKGVEIEGIAVSELGGTRYAFVGSERSNFVAVYDVSDADAPQFVQVLATTNGPEGLLPVPQRNLLVVSSEEDSAEDGVRSAVTVFGKGWRSARSAGTPRFPSIVSGDAAGTAGAYTSGLDGDRQVTRDAPIGWTALGALSADPEDRRRLWTASDAAKEPTSLYSVRTPRWGGPAVIDGELVVTDGGEPAALDVEGLWARPARVGGGFWLGSEGRTGAENALVRVSESGEIEESVSLPEEIAAGLGKWGIEGVAGTVDRRGEHLFVALQRGLTSDDGPGGYARIGRYDVATAEWTWFGYELERPTADGDWVGLSEVTVVDRNTLAVIERDKLNGPDAALKAVYTVDLPHRDPRPGEVAMLDKELAIDVLPRLRATNGWTQEKLEGLTIGGDGHVYAVTDNDALDDATGETVFLDLGKTRRLFR